MFKRLHIFGRGPRLPPFAMFELTQLIEQLLQNAEGLRPREWLPSRQSAGLCENVNRRSGHRAKDAYPASDAQSFVSEMRSFLGCGVTLLSLVGVDLQQLAGCCLVAPRRRLAESALQTAPRCREKT
jgi:hypothetical protein